MLKLYKTRFVQQEHQEESLPNVSLPLGSKLGFPTKPTKTLHDNFTAIGSLHGVLQRFDGVMAKLRQRLPSDHVDARTRVQQPKVLIDS